MRNSILPGKNIQKVQSPDNLNEYIRLSTIRHCDRIIVLDKGHIVEEGTYEALIAKNGFFAELVARQRLDSEE